jgi:hypothetical protein
MWKPQLSYAKPDGKETCSADRQADAARRALHDKVQVYTRQTTPHVFE